MQLCQALVNIERFHIPDSAGGGGASSEFRREKLTAKNHKLNEERKRRMQEEEKSKVEKQIKSTEEISTSMDCMHPSRLARMEENIAVKEVRGGTNGRGGKREGWKSMRGS